MKDLRFITVEGVIGAGKTSLVKILAKRFHAGKSPEVTTM